MKKFEQLKGIFVSNVPIGSFDKEKGLRLFREVQKDVYELNRKIGLLEIDVNNWRYVNSQLKSENKKLKNKIRYLNRKIESIKTTVNIDKRPIIVNKEDTIDDYVSVNEFRRITGYSKNHIRREYGKGNIKGRLLGHIILLHKTELEKWRRRNFND